MTLDRFDTHPTTRAAWIETWPNRQERYLAWCNATRRSPLDFDGPAFIAWIAERKAAFRAEHGLAGDIIPPIMQDPFTDYLWGGQP